MLNFKQKQYFSLRYKMAIQMVILVVAIMLVVTYIFTIQERDMRKEQVDLRMERLANNIASIRTVETTNWDTYQSYLDIQLQLNPDIVFVAIEDAAEEIWAFSLNETWIDLGGQTRLSRIEQLNIVQRLIGLQIDPISRLDFISKSVNITHNSKNLGTVRVGFSLVELNNQIAENLYRNLILAIVFIIAAILAALLLSRRIVKPLHAVSGAMNEITSGNFQQRVTYGDLDELGDLVHTFNFMAEGLHEKELIESFGRELSFTVGIEKISNLLTVRICQALGADSGYLLLRRGRGKSPQFKLLTAFPQINYMDLSANFSRRLCHLTREMAPVLTVADYCEFSHFNSRISTLTDVTQKTIVAPLIIKERVSALLLLNFPEEKTPLLPNDLKFLSTLVNQSVLAVETSLLYEELTEQERIKREIEIAQTVQKSFLPQSQPHFPGLDLDGICLPATEIGGDYYDYYYLNENQIGVVIADVTGKGTSAAFYMAVVKGLMLSLTPIFSSPKELLSELNRRLFGNMSRKVFVTMIYAVFDVKKRQLTFSRAGHNGLLWRSARNGNAEFRTPNGIGLGLDDGGIFDTIIREEVIAYEAGDTFLFFTDGISEAMNSRREEFSEERLQKITSEMPSCGSAEFRETIIREINEFVQQAPQHDDITMVTAKIAN